MTPRILEPGQLPDLRNSRLMTLIHLHGNEVSFANGRTEKDIIDLVDWRTDVLLLARTGQHKTDIFRLTTQDVERLYQRNHEQ
jgi:hypothetical protein